MPTGILRNKKIKSETYAKLALPHVFINVSLAVIIENVDKVYLAILFSLASKKKIIWARISVSASSNDE